MNELFNSPFETGLRVLLLLSTINPQSATVDRLTAYDFMTIYGKDFNLSAENLHGDSPFNFSELASKRSCCNEGIKAFVLSGLISVIKSDQGFAYALTSTGKRYVSNLSSDYAEQYLKTSKVVHEKFSSFSDEEIITLINKQAIKELRRKA